jgi:hypothetical protein
MKVVASRFAGGGIGIDACRGKHPLPIPFARRAWVFPGQGFGQDDGASVHGQIGLVLSLEG